MIKRYAIVVDDVVVNVADAEYQLAPNWIESNTACIGDLYIDGEFVKPSEDEE